MCTDTAISVAKRYVFGEPPAGATSLVGYEIARRYYGPLIDRAEPVLHKKNEADIALAVCLEKAFDFSSYRGFDRFPSETKTIIVRCGEKFQDRYGILLQDNIKAS